MKSNNPFPQPICEQIWNRKYRLITPNTEIPDDMSVEDTWQRIANAMARSYPEILGKGKLPKDLEKFFKERQESFFNALNDFNFLPAGRITAGAGSGRSVTLFNCLSANTKILTLEYGLIPIGQIANELVHILDGNGEWVEAPINSFGEQPTASVNLMGGYNRRQRESINATKGHRWLLSDGSETTTEKLKTGDVLKTVYRKDVDTDLEYGSGVSHGIIYGDGTKGYGPKFTIRLCGDKSELSSYFSNWHSTTPPSSNGDVHYFGTNGEDMKALPVGKSVEYMTGFLRGWFATDGCVDKRDGKPLLSCGKSELSWITQFGPICGMEVSYSSKLTDTTNYGQRNKEIFNVSFSKGTMIREDFLNSKHATNFKPSFMNWTVESVSNFGDPEPVYCPSVSTTESFQLGKGIHTSNCYVMGEIPDSMGGIFDMLKEAALTMQQGGGIGYDFSPLRPRNAPVKGVDADASGPTTFMDVWDAMCRTIMSAGARRGAMMATMACDHPDIEDFITAKRDPLRLRMFNVSVLATDEFMERVKNDEEWPLMHKVPPAEPVKWNNVTQIDGKHIYKIVSAKDLWNLMMESTYNYAEPGVLFVDRINKMNNLWYVEHITATNPCVAFDTKILTDKGYQKIGLLVGEIVNVWNGIEFSRVVPKQTGTNQNMVTVSLSDGSELRCTTAHKFILKDGTRVQADQLPVGTKLEKSEWPIIDGNSKYNIDMYSQGFFSGDGWVKKESGAQYIGLYGEKKSIPHKWNEKSRKTYDIVGGYTDTDVSQTKDYLFFGTDAFMPKIWIPFKCSIQDKRDWLSGLIDSDGCSVQGNIQITSKEYSFLSDVKKLINTMGSNGTLAPMKDCWRLSIPASYACDMKLKTYRVAFETPQRKATRFLKVVSVEFSGIEKEVFCFTEDKNHSGVFNGVYTAQCGEQPLPPYGACLLGSINLAKMVHDPFEEIAGINTKLLEKTAKQAVQMLDSIIDTSLFPIPQQEAEAKAKRRMGIGVTGLADMLFMLGETYGTDHACELTERIMKLIAVAAYEESIEMARKYGPCSMTETIEQRLSFCDSGYMKNMPEHIHNGVMKYGIRNALLISIAPTGTISLYAGNVSSGIEPIFAPTYTRNVLEDDGKTQVPEDVHDYAVLKYHQWREDKGYDKDPDLNGLQTAQTLTPLAHLKMQAAAQKWVDSSISKTINMPEDISFEDFEEIYMKAYEMGCKGCTTYRPNDVTGSVLTIKGDPEKEPEESLPTEPVERITGPIPRLPILNGQTYKLKWKGNNFYVTINNHFDEDGREIPFEIFINTQDMSQFQYVVALTRMMSSVFRRGGDVSFVIDDLKSIMDPNGGAFMEGTYIPSFIALLGRTVEQHLNFLATGEEIYTAIVESETIPDSPGIPDQCPECHGFNMNISGGCPVCADCGHSKCG